MDAKPRSPSAPRKVLIAMDGTQDSFRALRWYADRMNADSDQLIFAYVTEPPAITYGAGVGIPELFTEGVNEAVARGKKMAAEVKQRCQELGIRADVRFIERLTHGPGPALVEIADEEAVDAIVMGSRGFGALYRTFLGGVCDFVLKHASATTIVVPPPAKDQ